MLFFHEINKIVFVHPFDKDESMCGVLEIIAHTYAALCALREQFQG